MQDMHGLKVKVVAPARGEVLPENIAFFLFRTVRELLFNVVKHSGVKAARVEASRGDDLIQVVVEDEGAGFNPNVL
jgi:signal transduction histidine kinase